MEGPGEAMGMGSEDATLTGQLALPPQCRRREGGELGLFRAQGQERGEGVGVW